MVSAVRVAFWLLNANASWQTWYTAQKLAEENVAVGINWERSFKLQANEILKAVELKAEFPEALM